jgi:hypothetical protein
MDIFTVDGFTDRRGYWVRRKPMTPHNIQQFCFRQGDPIILVFHGSSPNDAAGPMRIQRKRRRRSVTLA